MKKTAVEWLIDMLVTENEITLKGENFKLFDQAKEMERTQIVKAYDKGEFNCGVNETSEQYYVKTYK